MSKEQIDLTKSLLKDLDTRKDGTVDLRNFRELMRRLQPDFSDAAFDVLCQHLCSDVNGRIPLNDFVDRVFDEANVTLDPTSRPPPALREWAVPVPLDRSIMREFMELDQGGKVQAEYIWIDSDYTDGRSFDLCSKGMTVDARPREAGELPIWTYSGADASDVHLVPRRIYRDPFRKGDNILVLADTYEEPPAASGKSHGPPTNYNTRAACDAMMARAEAEGDDPWFGIEQEYYLLDVNNDWPLGWPKNNYPGRHDSYYCATGTGKAVGRDIVECHYRACLFAGVKIGGINSEVAPGQWEFQVGPCSGTSAGDDLWIARYILQRICEMFHVCVTFDPKPIPGWAGIGCHTNYSTKATRAEQGGMDAMKGQIEKLRARHSEHIAVYGDGNERRLTGKDDTMSMDQFEFGTDRQTSIRIPIKVAAKGYGYYEDRRPAANMDPYLVTKLIAETTLFYDPSNTEEKCMVKVPVRRQSSRNIRCIGSRSPSLSAKEVEQAAA